MALNTINLTAGMRANLFSLQKTAKDMEVTQNRLSTGLKVNTALDDPLNFFAAQEHRPVPETWRPVKTVCLKQFRPSKQPTMASKVSPT